MNEKSKVVDIEAFKSETGLDDEQLKELYIGFMEEVSDEKEKLLVSLKEKDYVKLAGIVHNIKGISGSYMAQNVFSQAAELNARLKGKKTGDIEPEAANLIKDIIEAVGEISRYYKL